jgi:hypothetical protein
MEPWAGNLEFDPLYVPEQGIVGRVIGNGLKKGN